MELPTWKDACDVLCSLPPPDCVTPQGCFGRHLPTVGTCHLPFLHLPFTTKRKGLSLIPPPAADRFPPPLGTCILRLTHLPFLPATVL